MHSLLRLFWLYTHWPKVFIYILNQIDLECMLKCEILKTGLKGKIYAGRAVQSVQSTGWAQFIHGGLLLLILHSVRICS